MQSAREHPAPKQIFITTLCAGYLLVFSARCAPGARVAPSGHETAQLQRPSAARTPNQK